MGALVIGVVAGIGAAWALRESQKHHATEDGPVLLYTILLALGATLPWTEWGRMGWPALAFAVAVLLLRRMPAVFALMKPLGMRAPDAAYLGWFGPVGVAAIYYVAMEAERLAPHAEVLAAGALVVAVSTLAHGLTAAPGRAVYRRWDRAPCR